MDKPVRESKLVNQDDVLYDAGKIGSYRVRVLRGTDGSKVVDVRQYIETAEFTGFTRKGVRLRPDQALELRRLLGRGGVCQALGMIESEEGQL